MPPSRTRPNHNTGDNILYSFRTVSGFFNVPRYLISKKGCETEPTVYSPYPRRLESLTFADVIAKAALSPQLFKDPECWLGPGSTSRTVVRCSTKVSQPVGGPIQHQPTLVGECSIKDSRLLKILVHAIPRGFNNVFV